MLSAVDQQPSVMAYTKYIVTDWSTRLYPQPIAFLAIRFNSRNVND